jgi:hypothetical protein
MADEESGRVPGALGRAVLIAAIGVLAVCAAGLTWAVWEYEQLSSDVGGARTRLPQQISSVLAQAGATGDSPNVTLVRGYGGLATGGSLLFRSDPGHGQFSFLTIPHQVAGLPSSTTTAIDGPVIRRMIRRLRVTAGIAVNHVALLNFAGISRIVDALGGITVSNRAAFEVTAGGTRATRFPAGSLRLNGVQTVAFLSLDPTTKGQHSQRERNEAEVLQAVIEAATRLRDITHLLTAAKAIAANSATDLTTPGIIGLVAVRLRANRIVNCRLAQVPSLESAEARSAIAVFTARAETSPPCVVRLVSPTTSADVLGLGAVTVNRYGLSALVVALLVAVGAMAAAIALLAGRRVLPLVGIGAARDGFLDRFDDLSAKGRRRLRWATDRARPSKPGWLSHRETVTGRAGEHDITPETLAPGLSAQHDATRTDPFPDASRDTPPHISWRGDGPGDDADLVVQLRREGVSYRDIAQRLTDERGSSVSPEEAAEIWYRARGG